MRSLPAERTARAQRLIVVSLIALLLGFLLVVQLRSQAMVAKNLASQDNTSVALLINDLNRANTQLLEQSVTLEQREAALRQALAAGGADAKAIEKELTVFKAVAGELPVHGPGLEIRIEGPLQDFEVQDALNNLRNAGAEAFALNGYRIVNGTPILSRGDRLMVAGQLVAAPYLLQAIGDPEQLQMAADLSTSSLQTRVQVSVERKPDLAITAVLEPRPLVYAQLGS